MYNGIKPSSINHFQICYVGSRMGPPSSINHLPG
jgi:hypothetical protein